MSVMKATAKIFGIKIQMKLAAFFFGGKADDWMEVECAKRLELRKRINLKWMDTCLVEVFKF